MFRTALRSLLTMSSRHEGVALSEVLQALEGFAARTLAEPWDNVGLLVDPMRPEPIRSLLLTNDLTEPVLQEAVALAVDMIVSYHPPIFKPLKSLTASNWKERIVISCVKHGMAVYSPHTSWDVVDGGVNDWLSKALGRVSSAPITERGAGRLCQLEAPVQLGALVQALKQHIGIPHLRLALAPGKTLESTVGCVAICAGSGSGVLTGVPADLFLTGEMLHHDVLDATHAGTNVILCNHSDSERGFLKHFAPVLRDALHDRVDVLVSAEDADPLVTV